MKYAGWTGLGLGIFFGGTFGFFVARYLNLDLGLSESSVVFIFMFIFGLLGKKLGSLMITKTRKPESHGESS